MNKHSTLALAVGSALAAVGGSAHALLPPFSGSFASLYVSGATAQDAGFNAAVARLCVPGTLDMYTWGSNQRVLVCSLIPSIVAGLSTERVAIYKSGEGGSGLGVTPLVNGTAVPFLNVASITLGLCAGSTAVAPATVSGVTLVPAYTTRSCATSTDLRYQTILSDAGISDIEPKMFTDVDVGGLTAVTPAGLVFGVAVTNALYRELQKVQGVPASIYTDAATATLGTLTSITTLTTIQTRDLEQYMPSLSKETIGGLFAGQIDWSSIQGNGTVTPPAAQPDVFVARRFPSSGSQKSTELFLFGGINPTDLSHSTKCNPSAIAMQGNPGAQLNNSTDEATYCGFGPSVAPTAVVTEGSGTGNVRNCLNLHNTNGRFAIGLISMESSYASANGWRFIKIDGVTPSLLNAWKTTYKNFVEVSTQKAPYLTSGSDADKLADAIFGSTVGIGNPEVSRALNATFKHQFGDGATLSLAFNGAPALAITGTPKTMANIQAQPVWHYSKSSGLGGTDNCRPAFPAAPME